MKLLTDAAGDLTFLEPEWTRLTGQPVNEALGTGWLAKVHPSDREAVVSRLTKANRDKQQHTMTYRLSLARGDFKWVKTIIAPTVSLESGNVIGLQGILELNEKDDGLSDADRATNVLPFLHEKPGATTIEQIADLVIAARELADTQNEPLLAGVLDLALIEIGFRLAKHP